MTEIETFIDQLYQSKLKSATACASKEKLAQQLGIFTASDSPHRYRDARIVDEINESAYLRRLWSIPTINGLHMATYQLVPQITNTLNQYAILIIPGHGYGHRELVGLTVDNTKLKKISIYKNIAITLVKKGFHVYVPELVGMGKRRLIRDGQTPPTENTCYQLAAQLLLLGYTLTGLRVSECQQLIEFMQTMPDQKPDKLGVVGFSGGALISMCLAILNTNIQTTLLSGYPAYFKDSIMARRHCLDNYIPDMLTLGEMPDLLKQIAPRSLFIESGNQDHLFPIASARRVINNIENHYQSIGAQENFSYHLFQGGHEINGTQAIEWLVNQMNK
ncbi:alpha/beta hydrolase family protein [Amphibacillus cookii]|uniref:alpha/beta hydrolase family protein n=1 Tax=Amphibacillus cookii TaxID=767787 RepID=UPI00195E7364|nr:alpha/beta hydrolase family protein [Amphibacillus cookii]MBM7540693.1 dienelactone hydrolase [Amphibacillus cookii]